MSRREKRRGELIKAVAYLRTSSAANVGADKDSDRRQREAIEAFARRAGYEIIPVPVYYPEATSILGQPVYRKVADVPGEIDLVVVFRRSKDIHPHVDDIIAAHPKAVWFQSGIRNEEAAARLAQAGIRVVQDRCTMVDHRRVG